MKGAYSRLVFLGLGWVMGLGASCMDVYQREPEAIELENRSVTSAQDPSELIGQTITIEGEVNEVLTPTIFEMREYDIFNRDEVLVVNVDPATTATLFAG